MPGNKARSKYRKKRKGFQNRKIPRHGPSGIIIENSPSPLISPSVTSDLNNTIQPQPVECREKLSTPKTVSKRKLESHDMFSSEKKRASVAALPKSVHSKSADSNMPGYRIINMGQFGEALDTFHACDEGAVSLREDGKSGFNSMLNIQCSNCGIPTHLSSSQKIANGRAYDVNRRAVYFALDSGIGFQGLEKFSSIFDTPMLNKAAYQKHVESIVTITAEETEEELKGAALRLRKLLQLEDQSITDSSIIDIAVSFDGTWAKRGHTSLFGVTFVISVDSGEVLDYEVLSKFCSICSHIERQKVDNPDNYQRKRELHQNSGRCKVNYEGSSNAMEVKGAVRMWHRSIKKHGFRYMFMVSDGDSKSYNSVADSHCYGSNAVIQKIDCIGHVQKRMGKRLMMLKSTTKGKLSYGKPVGGKGRLTEAMIKRIQRFYGLAIRQNTTRKSSPSDAEKKLAVYQMKKNVLALLSHIVSREDLAAQHRYCPIGKQSWCAWQRDRDYGRKRYSSKDCLPEAFMELLRPIFTDLSSDKLLERCAIGATQNANESINSLVWLRCQKHKFCGLSVIKFAAASAIMQFNGGYSSFLKVMEGLGTPAGEWAKKNFLRRDLQRISQAERASTEKEKVKRTFMQKLKAAREDSYLETEGILYSSGSF